MKAVIFAGGFGSRMGGDTPKPLIEVNGKALVHRVIDLYAAQGVKDFIILAGYKQDMIKKYFAEYSKLKTKFFEIKNGATVDHDAFDGLNITIIDTGLNTPTAGRLLQARELLKDEDFFVTYSDGFMDVDLEQLVLEHKKNHNDITISVVNPVCNYGTVTLNKNGKLQSYREHQKLDDVYINAGFMVCTPLVFDYLRPNDMIESDFSIAIARNKMGYHIVDGTFKSVDTEKDVKEMTEYLNACGEWYVKGDK